MLDDLFRPIRDIVSQNPKINHLLDFLNIFSQNEQKISYKKESLFLIKYCLQDAENQDTNSSQFWEDCVNHMLNDNKNDNKEEYSISSLKKKFGESLKNDRATVYKVDRECFLSRLNNFEKDFSNVEIKKKCHNCLSIKDYIYLYDNNTVFVELNIIVQECMKFIKRNLSFVIEEIISLDDKQYKTIIVILNRYSNELYIDYKDILIKDLYSLLRFFTMGDKKKREKDILKYLLKLEKDNQINSTECAILKKRYILLDFLFSKKIINYEKIDDFFANSIDKKMFDIEKVPVKEIQSEFISLFDNIVDKNIFIDCNMKNFEYILFRIALEVYDVCDQKDEKKKLIECMRDVFSLQFINRVFSTLNLEDQKKFFEIYDNKDKFHYFKHIEKQYIEKKIEEYKNQENDLLKIKFLIDHFFVYSYQDSKILNFSMILEINKYIDKFHETFFNQSYYEKIKKLFVLLNSINNLTPIYDIEEYLKQIMLYNLNTNNKDFINFLNNKIEKIKKNNDLRTEEKYDLCLCNILISEVTDTSQDVIKFNIDKYCYSISFEDQYCKSFFLVLPLLYSERKSLELTKYFLSIPLKLLYGLESFCENIDTKSEHDKLIEMQNKAYFDLNKQIFPDDVPIRKNTLKLAPEISMDMILSFILEDAFDHDKRSYQSLSNMEFIMNLVNEKKITLNHTCFFYLLFLTDRDYIISNKFLKVSNEFLKWLKLQLKSDHQLSIYRRITKEDIVSEHTMNKLFILYNPEDIISNIFNTIEFESKDFFELFTPYKKFFVNNFDKFSFEQKIIILKNLFFDEYDFLNKDFFTEELIQTVIENIDFFPKKFKTYIINSSNKYNINFNKYIEFFLNSYEHFDSDEKIKKILEKYDIKSEFIEKLSIKCHSCKHYRIYKILLNENKYIINQDDIFCCFSNGIYYYKKKNEIQSILNQNDKSLARSKLIVDAAKFIEEKGLEKFGMNEQYDFLIEVTNVTLDKKQKYSPVAMNIVEKCIDLPKNIKNDFVLSLPKLLKWINISENVKQLNNISNINVINCILENFFNECPEDFFYYLCQNNQLINNLNINGLNKIMKKIYDIREYLNQKFRNTWSNKMKQCYDAFTDTKKKSLIEKIFSEENIKKDHLARFYNVFGYERHEYFFDIIKRNYGAKISSMSDFKEFIKELNNNQKENEKIKQDYLELFNTFVHTSEEDCDRLIEGGSILRLERKEIKIDNSELHKETEEVNKKKSEIKKFLTFIKGTIIITILIGLCLGDLFLHLLDRYEIIL